MYVRRTADPATLLCTRHSALFPPPLFLSLLLSLALFLFYSLVCWILHALILCSATKQATNFYNSHTKHTHSKPTPLLLPHTHTPLTPQVPLSVPHLPLRSSVFRFAPENAFSVPTKNNHFCQSSIPLPRLHASCPFTGSHCFVFSSFRNLKVVFFIYFAQFPPFFWQICSTIWTANYGNSQHTHRKTERGTDRGRGTVCACVWELLI